MYELKLLKTVQSEDSSARLTFLVTIHKFPMNLLWGVVNKILSCFPTSLTLKTKKGMR